MTPETPDDIEGFHEEENMVSGIRNALDTAPQATKDHRYSKKTRSIYQGHIERGKKYASKFQEMEDAFDKISHATPMMLRAFVSFQCQENNFSHKTAEGIRSAFKQYFQETFGCQGNTWKCDEDGNWSGNPVFDPPFVEYMASLKNRDGRSGVSKQSLPMSYNDMKGLMDYLQKEDTIDQHTEGLCLLFQAFATTGFTLWTRNEELLRLQGKDIERNLLSDKGTPYLTITLTFRKDNQADNSREKNARPLHPDDYLFPCLDSKGRVKIKEPFSHSLIQSLLDTFTNEAGLLAHRNGRFGIHCFRRGGAQYRFMFAEEKWSLKAVKWWGGWPEGERTGTIMRYLLDEFVRYESGFGDMLSPVRNDSKHSLFMGGAGITEPVTQLSLGIALEGQRREIDASISSTKAELRTELQQLHRLVSNVEDSLVRKLQSIIYGLPGILEAGVPQVSHQQGEQEREIQVLAQKEKQTRKQGQKSASDISLAPRIPDISNWREAIRQWDEGDINKGCPMPLKMWTASMRKSDPSKYSARKLIATEFNFLSRSELAMKEVHGGALNLVRDLIRSIREAKRQRKIYREGQEDGEEEEEEEEVEEEEEEEELEEDDDDDGDDDDEEKEKEKEEVEVLVRTKRRRV
ncbi:hypothetical protein BGZ79_001792 [Entomortierella chlamydospora]|nr:hypothetical protein BGZ79_001792 [Entomortierella chlamydospora]